MLSLINTGINASLSMDYESGMDDRLMGSDAIRLNEASAIDWRTKGTNHFLEKFLRFFSVLLLIINTQYFNA